MSASMSDDPHDPHDDGNPPPPMPKSPIVLFHLLEFPVAPPAPLCL